MGTRAVELFGQRLQSCHAPCPASRGSLMFEVSTMGVLGLLETA